MDVPGAAIRVRGAELSDVPQLAAIQRESALTAFAHIFPPSVAKPQQTELELEWHAWVDSPAHHVLIAESFGEPVAGVAFGGDEDLAPPEHGLLAKLYVRPGFSGHGIGSFLYESAVDQMRLDGWRRLWLWVLEGNAVARGMYERRGWVARDERRTDWPGSGVYEMGYSLDLDGDD